MIVKRQSIKARGTRQLWREKQSRAQGELRAGAQHGQSPGRDAQAWAGRAGGGEGGSDAEDGVGRLRPRGLLKIRRFKQRASQPLDWGTF